MKKSFVLLIAFLLSFGVSTQVYSAVGYSTNTTIIQDSEEMEMTEESASFTQELKKRFIEGGPSFMGIVLICLILGLAISIERIIFLNLASKHVIIDLSDNQKQFIKANIGRQIIIFTILWSGTKNLLVSFILTAIFVILADHIFNENSKYCILSKKLKSAIDTNNDGKITEKELDNAIKTINKLKQQTISQQISNLQR